MVPLPAMLDFFQRWVRQDVSDCRKEKQGQGEAISEGQLTAILEEGCGLRTEFSIPLGKQIIFMQFLALLGKFVCAVLTLAAI